MVNPLIIIDMKDVEDAIAIPINIKSNCNEAIKEYAMKEIADNIAERIKRRMPEASGELKRSLTVEPLNDGYIISINSPYAYLLEYGFSPHWVSQEIISAHLSNPGSTVGKTYKSLGELRGGRRYSKDVFENMGPPIMSVWKGPFVAPAVESASGDITNIINRKLNEAIKKSQSMARSGFILSHPEGEL